MIRFALFCAVFIFALVGISHVSSAETVSGTASVEIRQPVALSQVQALEFGIISADAADTISVAPDGQFSSLNGATLSGASNAGRFSAQGQADTAVIISFADGVLSGVGDSMVIRNFSHNVGASPRFDTDGALIFNVGADLVINASQLPGLYNGTYQVSVNYQ